MFTVAETELCIDIIDKLLKQQREKKPNASDSTESDQNAELMLLVSISNKLNNIREKHTGTDKKRLSPKVLIVDDVDDMQDVVRGLLSELGFEKIDAVSSAEKAMVILLDAAEAGTPYKVVLTDCEMSGKSGLELLKEIRVNETLSATDVFILSTNSEQKQIVAAMQSGVTGYILKPLNFKILQEKLGSYLPNIEVEIEEKVNIEIDNKTKNEVTDETVQ
jgi:two-component system, chemotaxis family, chemotaxis protein CheY